MGFKGQIISFSIYLIRMPERVQLPISVLRPVPWQGSWRLLRIIKPKKLLKLLILKRGVLSILSVTDLLRDRQQIRNIRRNLFSVDHEDEFAAILQKCKVDNDEPFICCSQAIPEPACIVATNHQLKQMEVNCTDENFSIVTGSNFQSRGVYVTPMVFMQKSL